MGEEITFTENDTYRAIQAAIDQVLTSVASVDPRVRAIVLTNLEQAQLWSLKLVKR